MFPCRLTVLLLLSLITMMLAEPPGCKIRITSKGLEMLKSEIQKFVKEELGNITIPDLQGKEGVFQYKIQDVKINELKFTFVDLRFQPDVGLVFEVHNSSISLSFQRQMQYWLLRDEGVINASAEDVNIHTALHLNKDMYGRLKISNISCDASVGKMRAKFSGTLGRVYDFLGTFLTTAMRLILNQQAFRITDLPDSEPCWFRIDELLVGYSSRELGESENVDHLGVREDWVQKHCPRAQDCILMWLVRTTVDKHVGIDYSLLSDPLVTSNNLDMDFRGMFFELRNVTDTLVNYAAYPVVREYDRMVYLALSEYFFDSGMYAYFKAGVFKMVIANEKMPKDLEMLLRTTYFGTIFMLNPALVEAPISLHLEVTSAPHCVIRTSGASVVVTSVVSVMVLPPGQLPVQLSSMTMETKLNAKVSMKGKRLAVQMDLRKFKIYSNQSALESLALIPLQGPLKAMLQLSIVPIINNRTKKGVQIPLPEGMDFIEEVVEYHNGFIIIGANLHFTEGLRELIEKNRQQMPSNSTASP